LKVGNGAHLHPKATKHKEQKEKHMGAWAPFLLRVDDGAHMHPQATKHGGEKKKKELDILPKRGDGAHPLPEATKEKEKKGSWALSKLAMAPTKTKTKIKKKKKKENRVLTFKLMFPNSPLLKLQAFHSSSSKLPKPKHSTC
jgi:hypothetical protein